MQTESNCRIKTIFFLICSQLILLSCSNQSDIKREFNEDLGSFFLQDIDYTDRMKISEFDGVFFCALEIDSRIFAKRKDQMDRYYIIHGVNTQKQFLKFKDSLFKFEARNNISIDDVIYEKNHFYLTINDSNHQVLPDTVLTF